LKRTIVNSNSFSLKNEIKELLDYGDLLYFLVKRDVNAIYKQTVLGFTWAIIRPFVQMIVFTLFFGKLAGIEASMEPSIPYAVFSYIALVPWTYFSTSFVGSTSSLVNNSGILSKVYFPRIIIPLTPIIAKSVDFIIAFSVVLLLLLYYGLFPSLNVLFLPLFVIEMVLLAVGMGFWFSAMAIQYRDVNQLMQFGVQILMYMAPIIWPISYIPEKYHLLYGLYPIAGIIEGFRYCLIPDYDLSVYLVLSGVFSTFFVLLTGLVYFKYKERYFADVV